MILAFVLLPVVSGGLISLCAWAEPSRFEHA
jgi:hypothetical protein